MHQPISIPPLAPTRSPEQRFFRLTALLMLGCVLVGFAPSFLLRPLSPPAVTALPPGLLLHGLLFTAWMCLYVAQAALVGRGALSWHRRLGLLGGVLAILMVWSGLETAVYAVRRGHPHGVDPRAFFALTSANILAFAALTAAGFALRKRPVSHKRLFFCANVTLLDPAIARLPFEFLNWHPLVSTGLAALSWLALLAFDAIGLRRIHAATLLGAVPVLLAQPMALAVGQTPGWLAFVASWIG